MRPSLAKFFLCASVILLLCVAGYGQSSCAPSLGDVARQQREKQKDDGKANATKTPSKVITNEDLPEHSEALDSADKNDDDADASSSKGAKSADQWKAEISAKKKEVASFETQLENLKSSIHFAPANCVRNCVQYNEQQEQKQQQAEQMQQQLEQKKKALEDLQDSARKAGFGNSIYDP